MKPHPDSEAITEALSRCKPILWSGLTYRSATPKYANRDDLVTGLGSKTAGGRWNPPGSFATVYLSLLPETALQEALAHFRHYQLPIENAMPRVIACIEAQLENVLDLTDVGTRRILRLSKKRILQEPWRELVLDKQEPLGQVLGRLTWTAGWEGMLVPSAALKGENNLIVFPANLEPPRSWLKIRDRDRLPDQKQ